MERDELTNEIKNLQDECQAISEKFTDQYVRYEKALKDEQDSNRELSSQIVQMDEN